MRINPKNFYQRELKQLPPHFKNVVVKCHEGDLQKIKIWVYENCSGRYSITKDVIHDGEKARPVYVIGFEDPGDLILFSLSGMAQLHQK